MPLAREEKQEIMAGYAAKEGDTGSPEVQIALLTERIKGLRRKESDAILSMLFEHIQKPEFLVRWRWKENAVAFCFLPAPSV